MLQTKEVHSNVVMLSSSPVSHVRQLNLRRRIWLVLIKQDVFDLEPMISNAFRL
jgi:hypothetical protein